MEVDKTEYDFKGLQALIKALKENQYSVRVGILAGKNARKEGLSNATIGAEHEFGNNVPQRSFLRMPLALELPKELEKKAALTEKDINQIIKEESVRTFSQKIGVLAVATVLKAFDSRGFGRWEPSNMKYKKTKQTLVETHQLRDSITFDVKKVK